MSEPIYIALIPLLPVISFLIIALVGRRYFPNFCGALGTLSLLASFLLSATVAYRYYFEVGKVDGVYQKIIALKYVWLQFTPDIAIDMGPSARPHFGDDDCDRDLHFPDGACLQFGLYEG